MVAMMTMTLLVGKDSVLGPRDFADEETEADQGKGSCLSLPCSSNP